MYYITGTQFSMNEAWGKLRAAWRNIKCIMSNQMETIAFIILQKLTCGKIKLISYSLTVNICGFEKQRIFITSTLLEVQQ